MKARDLAAALMTRPERDVYIRYGEGGENGVQVSDIDHGESEGKAFFLLLMDEGSTVFLPEAHVGLQPDLRKPKRKKKGS